jgi:hypothetical protein
MTTRRSRFGWPTPRGRPSDITAIGFVPVGGYTEIEDTHVPPGSWVSAANMRVKDGAMRPRSRLTNAGTNRPTNDVINGIWVYNGIAGVRSTMAASQGTVGYFSQNDSWVTLNYASGTSNYPPAGVESDTWFGTSVYEPTADLNIAVFTNSADPMYVWEGPSVTTAFSTMTQGPIAGDVCLFDNRPVAWNIQELSAPNRYVQRVQWPVAGDPYDWNAASIGAGFEDLVDMRGEGTRIFAEEDQMILASTEEIWRGRRVGLPYVFQFSPISRDVGMPYKRAAVQCPFGIAFLSREPQVYLMQGEQLAPIGTPIRDTLFRDLDDPWRAFMSYDPEHLTISLFYKVRDGATDYPTQEMRYHIDEKVWTRHIYQTQLTVATVGTVATSGSTTWQQLSGTISAQTGSYLDYLGSGTGHDDTFLGTSGGTVVTYSQLRAKDYGGASDDTVTAYIQTGALFSDPWRTKYVDEVRIDNAGDSASSLSIAVSGSAGAGYGNEQEVSLSLTSNSTQHRINMGVPGDYFALRFTSDDTGFAVSRVFVRARDVGANVI